MRKLVSLFWVMFKIGAFTFGGGMAMIPQMTHELTEKKKWLANGELIDLLSVCQSMPGVLAVNAAYLIGFRVAGWPGAFFGVFGAVLPSFFIMLAVTLLYENVIESPYVLGAMRGVRAAVTGLLLATVMRLRPDSVKNILGWLLFITAAALMLFTSLSAMWVIFGGLLTGFAALVWELRRKRRRG
jgi:chromate transporter